MEFQKITECRMGMKPEAITKVGTDHRIKVRDRLGMEFQKITECRMGMRPEVISKQGSE